MTPEDQAEAFIQAAINNAPEPLQKLGAFLADVLDEDRWATAEGYLLAIATSKDHITHDMEREGQLEFDRAGATAKSVYRVMAALAPPRT